MHYQQSIAEITYDIAMKESSISYTFALVLTETQVISRGSRMNCEVKILYREIQCLIIFLSKEYFSELNEKFIMY